MKIRDLAILAAVVVIAVVVAGQCVHQNESEWEDRVERLQKDFAESRARYEEALEDAKERADSAETLAEEARAHQPAIEKRIRTVRVETPPDLEDHPAIVVRDSIIDAQQDQIGRWRSAFEQQRRAFLDLQEVAEDALAQADSLSAVLGDRPSGRPWWLPRLGVGPYVGVNAKGEPSIGPVSAHISWEIKL